MSTTTPTSAIPPEIMTALQEAADHAVRGVRDPERISRAVERMDQMRAETYRKHGLLDIGVRAIRELRDGA